MVFLNYGTNCSIGDYKVVNQVFEHHSLISLKHFTKWNGKLWSISLKFQKGSQSVEIFKLIRSPPFLQNFT
jgi:hypothetical protein